MSDLGYYAKWTERVREMKHWPEPALWTNQQFQLLSEEISAKSKILINRNTVRKLVDRVISGEEYNPHSATKDAFAQYIGYRDWHNFTNQVQKQLEIKSSSKSSSKRLPWVLGFVAVVAVAIGFYLILKTDNTKIEFEVINPVGTIPHTIECKYNLKELKSDNIVIDYGHINSNGLYILAKLNKQNTTHKECFHYPGGYNVRLFVDNKLRTQQKVWINSLDWFVYVNDAQPYITKIELPEFLKQAGIPILQNIPFESVLEKTIDSSGYFHIPEERIAKVKNLSINYHTHLKNFRSFGVDIRNCQFKIRIKDAPLAIGTTCHETALYLHAEQGDIGFKFAEKGCERYTHQRIGKNLHSADTEDLSYLVHSFKEFKTVTIKCSPTDIKLMVDDRIIKTIEDNQPLGEVRGLDFWFKGSSFIDFVELADSNGRVVYSDTFDKEFN